MSATANGATAEALAAPGWTRRFSAMGKRLSEMVEFYGALGFEVRLEVEGTVEEAPSDVCEQCVVLTLARTIYTRRPSEADAAREESR